MTQTRRIVATVGILALMASLGGLSTYSAFSGTTANSNNSFAVGTVAIGDNDAGSFLYSVTNAKPADTVSKCIKVTYTGSLAADVKIYASAVAAVGGYIDLTVTPGTNTADTFPACTTFVASGAAIYTGTLLNFANTYQNYGNGLLGKASTWAANDSVVYKFTLTLQDDNGANGGTSALSTGLHSITWEARAA